MLMNQQGAGGSTKPATPPTSHVPDKTKIRGFSPQANYTDRANAAWRRS
jgi:hypothetical protein